MRYIEWLVLFILGACGTGLANFIGYGEGFMDSLPRLVVLIVGIFVMTGTFLGSCIWDQLILTLAGAI